MRAARTFACGLADDGLLGSVARVRAELFGSLGATGHGHGSDRAVILGLEGEEPETVDTATVAARVAAVRARGSVRLLGEHEVDAGGERSGAAPAPVTAPSIRTECVFLAYDRAGELVRERTFYSVGGGFVVDETAVGADRVKADSTAVRYPFTSAADLLARCAESGLPVSGVMLANETAWRPAQQIRAGLLEIWAVMQQCVVSGWTSTGVLPGGLKVPRRAPELYAAAAGRARLSRSAAGDGLGEPVRARRQRGERGRRAGGDRADQRGGGRGPGGAALLRPVLPGRVATTAWCAFC